MTDIHDGDGNLVLHNEYEGRFPDDISFDTVIGQETGSGHFLNFAYLDLQTSENVAERLAYESVVICPIQPGSGYCVTPNCDAGNLPRYGAPVRGKGPVLLGPNYRPPSSPTQPPPPPKLTLPILRKLTLETSVVQDLWGFIYDYTQDIYGVTLPAYKTDVTDPYGISWTMYFDVQGQLLRRQNNTSGAVESFNYDVQGNLVGIQHPDGSRTCRAFDNRGDLLQEWWGPAPIGFSPGYQEIQRVFRYRTLQGGVTRLEVEMDPRNPFQQLKRYEWDERGALRAVSNARGERTWYELDERGVPLKEHRPGSDISYGYAGGTLSRVEVAGTPPLVTSLQVDAAGRPTLGTGPFGEKTEWFWSEGRLDRVVHTNDNKAETITHLYDGNGRLRQIDNGQRRSQFGYDRYGLIARISHFARDGSLPTNPLDALNNDGPFEGPGGALPGQGPGFGGKGEGLGGAGVITDPLPDNPDRTPRGSVVSCFLNGPDGRLLEVINPEGLRIKHVRDEASHLWTTSGGALPRAQTWDEDCPAFLGSRRATGTLSSTSVDSMERPTAVTNADGTTASIRYDVFGRPVIVQSSDGRETRQGFDQLGNVTWVASYEASRAPAEYRRPIVSGSTVEQGLLSYATFTYDSTGRLELTDELHFDDNGQLVGDGHAITRRYLDVWGRRLIVTDDAARTTTEEWDSAGRTTRRTNQRGGVVTFEYRDNGRSIIERATLPTPSNVVATLTTLTAWGAPESRSRLIGSNPPSQAVVSQTIAAFADYLAGGGSAGVPSDLIEELWLYDEHKRPIAHKTRSGSIETTKYDALDRPIRQTVSYATGETSEAVELKWTRDGLLSRRYSVAARNGEPATTFMRYDALRRLWYTSGPGERTSEVATFLGGSSRPLSATDERGVVWATDYDTGGRVETITATAPGGETETRSFVHDPLGRALTGTAVAEDGVDVVTQMRWDSLGNRTAEWS